MKNLSRFLFQVPFFLLALTPVLWFISKGDILINGVDINFPLDPVSWFERRFFVWNPIANGGVDFSSSTAGLFFHFVQVVPYKLGFSLIQVQTLSLIFWFALIIFSSWLLARIILQRKPLLQILFVVLYSFNIYMFNSWENIKVANLSLVASIPMALSLMILLHDKKITYKKAFLFASLTGIVVSGGGINPSYFITFFLIMFLYFLGDFLAHIKTDSFKNSAKNILIVILPIILVNLFWILPTLNFIFNNLSPSGSIDKLGFTNWVNSLSENTSLVNIFRLQGAWDWYAIDLVTNQPLYIPYSINYFHRLSFLIFSFLLPSLAILSFLFVNKVNRHLYTFFGLMLLLGIFLGAGTHDPTGSFFKWIAVRLPFFTLFRSPWYIFSPLVTLSYAGLICLFLYCFKIQRFSNTLNTIFLHIITITLIIGNLVYSYPLVTGKIFRPSSPDGFYIHFPQYVLDAKTKLGDNSGRIIGYPDDEIEKFSWGYRGIESILNLLVSRQTLFSPLNTPDSPMAILVKKFYQHLKRGEWQGAQNLSLKMGASMIFEKKDQSSLSPPLPKEVALLPSINLGPWSFHQLQENAVNQKVNATTKFFFAYPYTPYPQGVEMVGVLEKNNIILNPEDSVIAKIPEITIKSSRVVLSNSSQGLDFNNFKLAPSVLSNRLISRDMTKNNFEFTIPEEGSYQPVLGRYRLEDFGIDLSKDLKVEVDGVSQIWKINNISDTYVYFQPIEFGSGSHQASLTLSARNLVTGGDFEKGDNFQKSGYGEGLAEYKIEGAEGEKFLSVLNIKKSDVSADFKIDSFDPMANYYVELRYKQIYGNNANVLVTQNTANTLVKAQVERLPNYPEWHIFSFYYQPVETLSEAKLTLNAPFTNDPLGTKILYDDIKLVKVFNNDLIFIKQDNFNLREPTVEQQKSTPVSYEGTVIGSDGFHILTFSENYSPFWELQLFTTEGKNLGLTPPHFSADLYANAWFIEGTPNSYKFKIYYTPQKLFLIGLTIGLLTFIFSIIIFLVDLKGRRNV